MGEGKANVLREENVYTAEGSVGGDRGREEGQKLEAEEPSLEKDEADETEESLDDRRACRWDEGSYPNRSYLTRG